MEPCMCGAEDCYQCYPGYASMDKLFRSLSSYEVSEFEDYARSHVPDMELWALYHPVCRRVWATRGYGRDNEGYDYVDQ